MYNIVAVFQNPVYTPVRLIANCADLITVGAKVDRCCSVEPVPAFFKALGFTHPEDAIGNLRNVNVSLLDADLLTILRALALKDPTISTEDIWRDPSFEMVGAHVAMIPNHILEIPDFEKDQDDFHVGNPGLTNVLADGDEVDLRVWITRRDSLLSSVPTSVPYIEIAYAGESYVTRASVRLLLRTKKEDFLQQIAKGMLGYK